MKKSLFSPPDYILNRRLCRLKDVPDTRPHCLLFSIISAPASRADFNGQLNLARELFTSLSPLWIGRLEYINGNYLRDENCIKGVFLHKSQTCITYLAQQRLAACFSSTISKLPFISKLFIVYQREKPVFDWSYNQWINLWNSSFTKCVYTVYIISS